MKHLTTLLLLFCVTGCGSSKTERINYPDIHAYGRVWRHYEIITYKTVRPFVSGHGILVDQMQETSVEYIESNHETINLNDYVYANTRAGENKVVTQYGYITATVHEYDNKNSYSCTFKKKRNNRLYDSRKLSL